MKRITNIVLLLCGLGVIVGWILVVFYEWGWVPCFISAMTGIVILFIRSLRT